MRVPPKKPHFFKPILPSFKRFLKIPIGFLKYLKGQEQEYVVLTRAGKKWLVKLNGRRLEEGWEKFAEEHDLQLGNILVFRHEGNMEFEVVIFDSSHCDRDYAEHLQEDAKEEDEEAIRSKKFELKDKPNPCVAPSRKAFPNAESATHSRFGQSHFVCTVRSYCFIKGYLRVPLQFAKANGLTNKKCDLIIRDERQRSWNLRLTGYNSQVYMLGEWRELRTAHDLKVGDRIMFEVVSNGETPIWKFHDKRNPKIKSLGNQFPHAEAVNPKPSGYSNMKLQGNAFPQAEAATHKPCDYSRFVCTVRPYSLSNDLLYIPKQFALANGLTNKKCYLIIKDERQRSWNLKLGSFGSGAFIHGGWHEFRDTNCLKQGDQIMFEVVTNGEKPIWKFHGNISVKDEGIHSRDWAD